jgi:hypothetical protein
MATRLESVSMEALLAEIQRRFDRVEKAKSLLLGGTENGVGTKGARLEPGQRTKRRRRGGVSPYARQVGSLVQKIRHAKGRGEDVSKLQKQLTKLRAQRGESK